MPANKNDKNGTGPSGTEEQIRVSNAAFDSSCEYGEASSVFPGDPRAGRKHVAGPEPDIEDELDEELNLTYLACDRLFELALVRAGFVQVVSSYKQAQPDWYRWARHIEKQFDPGSAVELEAAVDHLLSLREDMESLPGRLQNRLTWESASPFSDNLCLAEMLQQTRLQLTHHYNIPATPGCDSAQVMAALFVAQEWLQLVPG
jgi:hypothetical protein